MSSLKFLLIFDIIPKSRNCFKIFSWKLANQTFSIIIIFILLLGFIIDIKYSSEYLRNTFKYIIFCGINFISSFFLFKSSTRLVYRDAYLGYHILFWCFFLHTIIFIINVIFKFNFFPFLECIDIVFTGSNTYLISISIQLVYLLFEFFYLWVTYSYTKNLGLGKDALVDGQTFDRYIENLASSESSRRNSDRNLSLHNLDSSLA
jgi:hypothetical protein